MDDDNQCASTQELVLAEGAVPVRSETAAGSSGNRTAADSSALQVGSDSWNAEIGASMESEEAACRRWTGA